jgi:DNA mismatch endonuclease (patch repair protein)
VPAPDRAARAPDTISLGAGVRVDYPRTVDPGVRSVMRANRRCDTRPEVALRSALHRRGLRFRKDAPIVAEQRKARVDIAFPRQRVAVFVDGCFWHRCPQHGTEPRANATYWQAKLDRNQARDATVNLALESCGWTVIRVWEHEDPNRAAAAIEEIVRSSA